MNNLIKEIDKQCRKDYVILPNQETYISFKANKFGILHIYFEPTDLNDTLVINKNDQININL